jgi:hypothetical protein
MVKLMFRRLLGFFRTDKQINSDERYIQVPVEEFSTLLKQKIIQLEQIAEEWCEYLQKKYAKEFEIQGKKNLRIWVCRDIDGEEIAGINSDQCFEKEYRSQIAIDYDGTKFDEEFYADTILLWYYFGGYIKGSGTFYNSPKSNIEYDIEHTLKSLTNHNNGFDK